LVKRVRLSRKDEKEQRQSGEDEAKTTAVENGGNVREHLLDSFGLSVCLSVGFQSGFKVRITKNVQQLLLYEAKFRGTSLKISSHHSFPPEAFRSTSQ
jgi:hypothetical protein